MMPENYFQKYLLDQLSEIKNTQTEIQVSIGQIQTEMKIENKNKKEKIKRTASIVALVVTGILNILNVLITKWI